MEIDEDTVRALAARTPSGFNRSMMGPQRNRSTIMMAAVYTRTQREGSSMLLKALFILGPRRSFTQESVPSSVVATLSKRVIHA